MPILYVVATPIGNLNDLSPRVQEALEAIPPEEEYGHALEHARKLCRKFQNDPTKIAQSLLRKGFHWSLAKRAAEEAAKE